jgi:hypothetical protein
MGGRRALWLLIACPLLLAGCNYLVAGVAAPMVIQQKEVNLANSSYAAADTLSVQADGWRFDKNAPLLVPDLTETVPEGQGPGRNPKLGQVIAGQIRTRLTDLGYNIIDMERYAGGGTPGGEVSGVYEITSSGFASRRMNVSLTFRDSRSGRAIGSYQYSLPVTYDIRKYMANGELAVPKLFN